MSPKQNIAQVHSASDVPSVESLLRILDQINDKARDLSRELQKQGVIASNSDTDITRIAVHKSMKRRLRKMYEESDNDY